MKATKERKAMDLEWDMAATAPQLWSLFGKWKSANKTNSVKFARVILFAFTRFQFSLHTHTHTQADKLTSQGQTKQKSRCLLHETVTFSHIDQNNQSSPID